MKRVLLFFATLWLGIMGASAQSYKYDLNDDGVVNVTDVIQLVNYILGKENGSQGIQDTHEAVDLGLPSGTKWATCNVGASKPEEYGGYYAWGETEEKEDNKSCTWENYMYYNIFTGYVNLGEISGTEYDVAHVKWGGNWVMPTLDDILELFDNCMSEWTMVNGVNGRKFISKINGKSIFLPAAGASGFGHFGDIGEQGNYWSSMQDPRSASSVSYFFFSSGDTFTNGAHPYFGLSVRPVAKNKYDLNDDGVVNVTDVIQLVNYILGKENGSQGIQDTHEAVDLGLPSGTKWATCNVGATKPEEYGGYYAWGETEEKKVYNESTYKYYQDDEWVDLGSDISGTEYDVAHVKWGGNWCMPTMDDIKELLDNCTSEWTRLSGVHGRKFTSKINGKSIFLPAAGYRRYAALNTVDDYGNYRSSTQNPDDSVYACYLFFKSSYADWGNSGRRYFGLSVRPVVRN